MTQSVWKTVSSEARVTRDEVSGDKNAKTTVWKTVPNNELCIMNYVLNLHFRVCKDIIVPDSLPVFSIQHSFVYLDGIFDTDVILCSVALNKVHANA